MQGQSTALECFKPILEDSPSLCELFVDLLPHKRSLLQPAAVFKLRQRKSFRFTFFRSGTADLADTCWGMDSEKRASRLPNPAAASACNEAVGQHFANLDTALSSRNSCQPMFLAVLWVSKPEKDDPVLRAKRCGEENVAWCTSSETSAPANMPWLHDELLTAAA